jgi:hypothetical protein
MTCAHHLSSCLHEQDNDLDYKQISERQPANQVSSTHQKNAATLWFFLHPT